MTAQIVAGTGYAVRADAEFPECLEDRIGEDTPVRAIDVFPTLPPI